ncbi:MAG: hypothetical protein CVU81_02385 [Euryarchaeota archaeon HGW-Euryarchaeota-1]|nr:MAG: hypothetical protein CVU81_02385 [Euryarchaeota archaeon HGW-Euryarchaeota-1]
MKDKETRQDIEDIKEASKSRDFFDILRKRQRRNVLTEGYRETEQAENAFFKERAEKHETEGLLDKPILKKSFIAGVFLLILVALIVLAFVFFMQQQADVEIKFSCAMSNETDTLSFPPTHIARRDTLYCNSTIIPKNNLTNVDVCLYYDKNLSVLKEPVCDFNYNILPKRIGFASPLCVVVENMTASQEYNCVFEMMPKANISANPSNAVEVCYVRADSGKKCVKKNPE